MQPAATRNDYEIALDGLEFPASLPAIVRTAADRGGIDREVLEVLGRLPDRRYESLEDLLEAVRESYRETGYEPPL